MSGMTRPGQRSVGGLATPARGGSRVGVTAGLIAIAIVVVVDAALSPNLVLIGLLIIGPLVAATSSRPRDVAMVTAIALVAGLLLGIRDHRFGSLDHVLRLVIVLAGGLLAIWTASIRQSREKAAALLAAQAATARILTSTGSLAEAAPDLLATTGRLLGWSLGVLWTVDGDGERLSCLRAWADEGAHARDFVERTLASSFSQGQGLPGRVWKSGHAAWLPDVRMDDNFPRLDAAVSAGFRAAFCFPILSSGGVLGAIEFFADEPRAPDRHVLDLMDRLGVQLGEYVERRRAEEARSENEARKSAILHAALDSIVTMDHDGRVVEFNPAAERTFGYSAEEAIGRELAELIVPPEFRERHRSGLARYLESGEGKILERRVELRGMRKDGSEFPLELTVTRISVEPPMFTGYLRDLSERVQAEAVQQRLASIVASTQDAVLSKDLDCIINTWNRGAEQLYGYAREEAIGMPVGRLVPEHRSGEEFEILERVLTGEQITSFETERVRKDGTLLEVSLTVSPLRDASGRITGASTIAHDITEQKRVQRQITFLSEAQRVLSSSLDYEVTLKNVARLVVPHIADWCAIDIVAANGELQRLALAHVDPAKERLVAEIEERYPSERDRESGPLKALRTRTSELMREIPRELLEQAAQDDEHMRLIDELGLRSAMIVPLLARDRAIGTVTLASAESGRRFDENDLALAEDLAGRAAVAVDNARLYSERSYVASTLQQALLPDNLPELPEADLAARYLAAGEVNEVGGDFYDIYRSVESTWALAIGDVRGKGPRAAAVTALVRYTLRAASLNETLPSRVLATLNEAMVRQQSSDRFCTVAYASILPTASGRLEVTLGVGGHPLPLMLRRDGSVEQVGIPGTLIGFMADPEISDERFELGPGDSLVLYTDGVSEARSENGLFGEQRLMELLRGCAGSGATEIADRIQSDVLEFQGGTGSDDLAVLVLRVRDDREVRGGLEGERLEPAGRSGQ
jgi:PAS domain S-box-containing protein